MQFIIGIMSLDAFARPRARRFAVAAMLVLAVCTCPKAIAADASTSTPPRPSSGSANKDPLDALLIDAKDETSKSGVSGFIDVVAAYTYADPSHWSQATGRAQLDAHGQFNESVKWKLGGRVDGDLVYASSNFYLPDVKRDQRNSFFWRENYLDVAAGDWDFRLGAQQIIWGEVVGLFFADVVSARDMREFLLPTFDIIRIPQWAARAEYFAGDSHLELIWIPRPTFDNIGKPGADFYPARLPSPTPADVAALFHDPVRPSGSLSNSNYGVRVNTLVEGWDLSAFYYRSSSTQPTFYRGAPEQPGQPFVFLPSYDRIWQAGGTVSKDLGDWVFRGEAVYTHGQGQSVADLDATTSVVRPPTLDAIISGEVQLPYDTRLNVQAFDRVFFGSVPPLALKNEGFGMSVLLSTKLGAKFEPQILLIRNFSDGGSLIRPRLDWHAAKNTTISLGVDIFSGPADTYFGRFNNRDRAYVETRYSF